MSLTTQSESVPGRRGEQLDLRRPHDVHRMVERGSLVDQDVGTVGDEALIVDQPGLPLVLIAHVDGPGKERHRLGGI